MPSATIMHEYLLVYGEGWVCERYSITGDKIDEILYGFTLPTEDRNANKVRKAFMCDEERGKRRTLSMYFEDRIWIRECDMNSKEKRCANSESQDAPALSEECLNDLLAFYRGQMSSDMIFHGNVMRSNCWGLGSRKMIKETSKTSDDKIHDVVLDCLIKGKLSEHVVNNVRKINDFYSDKNNFGKKHYDLSIRQLY